MPAPQQTRAELALILGYKDPNAQAIDRALAALQPGEMVLGVHTGTAKYLGATVQRRIRARYSRMTRLVPIAYGYHNGSDVIAVIGQDWQAELDAKKAQ